MPSGTCSGRECDCFDFGVFEMVPGGEPRRFCSRQNFKSHHVSFVCVIVCECDCDCHQACLRFPHHLGQHQGDEENGLAFINHPAQGMATMQVVPKTGRSTAHPSLVHACFVGKIMMYVVGDGDDDKNIDLGNEVAT